MFGFAFSSTSDYLPTDLWTALTAPLPQSPPLRPSSPPLLSPELEQPLTSPLPSSVEKEGGVVELPLPPTPASASSELGGGRPTRKRQRSSSVQPEWRDEQLQPRAQQVNEDACDQSVTNVVDEHDASDDERQHKLYRTVVLQATVNKARQLYDRLSLLDAACHRQHDEIQQLRHQLEATTAALHAVQRPSSPAPTCYPAASSSLDFHLSSSVLSSSLQLAARVGISVTDGQTGYLIDVNAHLLHNSGWQRSDAIGRQVVTPYAEVMRCATGEEETIDSLVTLPTCPQRQQYRSSYSRLRRLYQAEVDKMDAVWRCVRDGRSIELSCCCWVADWVSLSDGQAGVQQLPGRVVWVLSLTDAKVVD